MPGYDKELLVLPFDHRASFQEKMFGIHGVPTAEQTALVASYKTVIFEGFERAVATGLPKDEMGILVDEQFGQEVIARTKKGGYTLCICAEKSGQDEFDFEHGSRWKQAIEETNPEIVKVLVRYNTGADHAMNLRQAARLADLGRYLATTKRKYMFELLVPPTPAQLTQCKGDKKVFDVELRPALMIEAIRELQKEGVDPDIWKLEGLDREEDFRRVVEVARADGRDRVGCILLGRGEDEAKVRHWLTVGANVPGVIGFAVGRTIWWEPLKAMKAGTITKDQAIDKIAANYGSLCKLWLDARR